uniref:Uncharacterized protein n=1 Tax=Zooxanthella nutricula TaxID=1333877 RepID=A0A6U6TAI9_9DINO|mmetsp:Transcript_7849/g.23253  ORF Transcript_7849/g.23253 Transcript_7849/m.23253 type:complete len:260 (+) Transcript_7849:3-782(+)
MAGNGLQHLLGRRHIRDRRVGNSGEDSDLDCSCVQDLTEAWSEPSSLQQQWDDAVAAKAAAAAELSAVQSKMAALRSAEAAALQRLQDSTAQVAALLKVVEDIAKGPSRAASSAALQADPFGGRPRLKLKKRGEAVAEAMVKAAAGDAAKAGEAGAAQPVATQPAGFTLFALPFACGDGPAFDAAAARTTTWHETAPQPAAQQATVQQATEEPHAAQQAGAAQAAVHSGWGKDPMPRRPKLMLKPRTAAPLGLSTTHAR